MNFDFRPSLRAGSVLLVLAILLAPTATAQDDSSPIIEPVRFDGGGITLAGELVMPAGEGPFPAVVLVDGSGQTTRKNMRDFAMGFASSGFAALAYDKRGVGESGGDREAWRRFRFEELAADAAGGADYLASREDIDEKRIGLLGVSQGGWVVPLAATITDTPTFMILISPSVTPVAEDRLFERSARLRHEGFSATEIAEVREMQLADQAVTRTGKGFDVFRKLWRANEDKRWFQRVYLNDEPAGPESSWRRWYRHVLDYDPIPALQSLSIPALWIFGDPEHDRLGPVRQSLENVKALKSAGKNYTIKQFPGTNHNIQPVSGKDAEEGGDLPVYVSPMFQWLEATLAKRT